MYGKKIIYEEKKINEIEYIGINDLRNYFEKNFSNSCLEVFDDFIKLFLTKIEDKKTLSDYFTTYIYLLLQIINKEIEDNSEPFSSYSNIINYFLHLDTIFDKGNYELIVKNKNPLYLATLYSRYYDLKNDNDKLFSLEYRFHNYFSFENERFYLNVDDIDWNHQYQGLSFEEILSNVESIKLKNYNNTNQLSKVEAYRIIEKCINYKREKCSLYGLNYEEIIDLSVAVFGTLENKNLLIDYLSKYENINLEITEFKNNPRIDKMIFNNDRSIYNLASRKDLKEIFENYHMVLFMDQPAFYNRLLSEKEKRYRTKLSACKIFIKNYADKKDIDKLDNFTKIDIIKNVYKLVEDLNSLSDQMVCFNYHYDKFFISNAVKALSDIRDEYSNVYFYISQIDATENIFNNKDILFKKEIYNQRDLIVLRPQMKNEHFGLYSRLKNEIIYEKKYYINTWKIMKFDECYLDTFFDLYDDKEQMIHELVDSYISFDFENYEEDNLIFFSKNLSKISKNPLKKYCENTLEKMTNGLKKNVSYILKKFANSIFSESKNLNYIMLYYFIDKIDFSNLIFSNFDDKSDDKANDRVNNLNYVQKTSINNVLEILENTIYKEEEKSRVADSIDDIFIKYVTTDVNETRELVDYLDKWLQIYKVKSQTNDNLNIWKEGKCNYE